MVNSPFELSFFSVTTTPCNTVMYFKINILYTCYDVSTVTHVGNSVYLATSWHIAANASESLESPWFLLFIEYYFFSIKMITKWWQYAFVCLSMRVSFFPFHILSANIEHKKKLEWSVKKKSQWNCTPTTMKKSF